MTSKKNEVANTEPTQPLNGVVLPPETPNAPASARVHRATFATDNIEGGYMVRIEGPNAEKFARRKVPVTRFNGEETEIELKSLTWTGPDKETGKKVALYKIIKNKRPAKDTDSVAF